MAFIVEVPNPFQPTVGMKKHTHEGGISVWDWLRQQYPGFVEFDQPTICLVNGNPLLRKDWDRRIGQKDVITFMTVIGDPVTLIIAIVAIVLAVVLVLTLGAPQTPGEQPASDPVFSTKGQTNSIRLGEPIECSYGRNRIYPSYASRPFFRYDNNDQYQHSLFCIGQGVYDIDEIRIGDTDIDSFAEVEYEVIEPGGTVSLFLTNVNTVPEVGNLELLAPNEPDYAADGWVGPFAANDSGTVCSRLEVDFVLPRGLYRGTKKGISGLSLTFIVERRLIDDDGNPLGPYTTIVNPTLTMKTTTPQRLTYGEDVAEGRYEVRCRRTSNSRLSDRAGEQLIWDGLRAFITGEEPDYGDVTLLAVKIRATNNLNVNTQERFNVIATRKLPIRYVGSSGDGDSYGWSVPIATRSIVWAFVDVFRATYGARIDDDTLFDWDALYELETTYASRGEYFDFTFRDPITVWQAALTIARAGRAVPLIQGSLISIKRDGPLSLPVAMFTPDNIVKGSFQWEVKLWEPNEFDSLQVEYTDASTGYKQEQVLCILPDDASTAGSNPKDLRLIGVQDRDHAYREGLYILAVDRYLRENATFETGLEGYIPTYGDLIAVSHDVPRWGQSGYVLAAEDISGTDKVQLYVSEPLNFDFDSAGEPQVLLRGNRGQIIGPLVAEETSDPKIIIVTLVDEGSDFTWLLGGETEPCLFLFGVAGNITEYLKVVRVEPQGGERIKITCVPELSIVHSFDELTAPALDKPSTPPVASDAPTISNLTLTQLDDIGVLVQASWTATFGAKYYIVQSSTDGENWQFRGTTDRTSMVLPAAPGEFWVRVAAVNNGQGPWITESIDVFLVFGLENHIPWDDDQLQWGIRWWEDLNVDAYLVRIYDNTTPSNPTLLYEVQTTSLSFIWDLDDAVQNGTTYIRDLLVTVDVMTIDEDTLALVALEVPREIEITNAIPSPPDNYLSSGSGINFEFISEDSSAGTEVWVYRLFWEVPEENDLITIKVWLSATQGFDPEVDTPVFEETYSAPGWYNIATECYVEVAVPGGIHPDYYWRVGVFDIWGNEISTNVSDEQRLYAIWILESGSWDDYGSWEDENTWNDA